MKRIWQAALCGWLAMGASTAHAADEYPFDDPYPFETRDFDAQKLRESDRLKLGEDAAPWLPPIIAALRANRPPMHQLRQVALFPAERDGVYLVTTWQGGDMPRSYVQFHRIETAQDGRRIARFMREISEYFAFVDAPTGMRLTPAGASIVVVDVGNGSMSLSSYTKFFIMLARNTIDVTPDWAGRLAGFADLDGDGVEELVAYDDGWAGYFNGRSVAGPHLPIALRARGRFVADCAGYEGVYRRLAAQYAAHAADEKTHPVLRSEAYGAQILVLAQIADFPGAREVLERLEIFYRAEGDKVLDDLSAETVREDFAKAIAVAEAHGGSSCPLSAGGAQKE